MDRSTIEFNYSRALDQASSLEIIEGKIKTIANSRYKGVLQDVSVAWKGDNSPKYVSKGETVSGIIAQVAGNVNSVAATIRTVAKNIYDAEMEALRIEEERAYRARLAAEEAEEAKRKAKEEAKNASGNGKYSGGGGGGGRGR